MTAATIAANLSFAKGSEAAASSALKHYVKKRAASAAWKLMGTATARGLARSLGAEAVGALGIAGVGVSAEVMGAGAAGWEIGTAISGAHLSSGQTVNNYLVDKASGFGSWMQQNTSFGH